MAKPDILNVLTLGLRHEKAEARRQRLVDSLLTQVKPEPDALTSKRVELGDGKFRDERSARLIFSEQGLWVDYVEYTNERGVSERFMRINEETSDKATTVEVLEVQTPGFLDRTETRVSFYEAVLVRKTLHSSDVRLRKLDETETHYTSYWATSNPGEFNTPQALATAQRLVSKVTQAKQQ